MIVRSVPIFPHNISKLYHKKIKCDIIFFLEFMIDLHTHTTASDGTCSPAELVQLAVKKKIKVLAVTDHDTVSGLEEAQAEAKKHDIVFIPGIELNIQWPTGEFHLLGLCLETLSPSLKDIIDSLEEGRLERNEEMARKLRENGIDITVDELQERFGTKNIGRPHFAQVLQEKRIVRKRQEAFDRFFAKGRPCFVDRRGADLQEAVNAIKDSGGIPIQAHPLSMYVAWGKLKERIADVLQSGIMGLEAWHPGARISEAERLVEMAHDFGVIATGGSDFHGEKVRSDRMLGHASGKLVIQDCYFYDELLPLVKKYRGESPSFTFKM